MPKHYSNCLYVHGLHSSVNTAKMEILEKYFEKVTALNLDYIQQHDAYHILKQICLDHKVDFIIGSSFGGYFGFFLSRELNLPAILFNPAFGFRKQDSTYITHDISGQTPYTYIVSGEKDDVVPTATVEIFLKDLADKENISLVKCNWLAHMIDLSTFEAMTAAGVQLSLKKLSDGSRP